MALLEWTRTTIHACTHVAVTAAFEMQCGMHAFIHFFAYDCTQWFSFQYLRIHFGILRSCDLCNIFRKHIFRGELTKTSANKNHWFEWVFFGDDHNNAQDMHTLGIQFSQCIFQGLAKNFNFKFLLRGERLVLGSKKMIKFWVIYKNRNNRIEQAVILFEELNRTCPYFENIHTLVCATRWNNFWCKYIHCQETYQ